MDDRAIREPDATAASEATGDGTKLRALLVGIDFYFPNKLPNDASYQKLRGCVSDIQRVETMLRDRVKPEPEIVTLLAPNVGEDEPSGPKSGWPTYANITAALRALLVRTQPGDQVYIHFSGHGGRVPTRFKDLKGESYDVTLVPTDIGDAETRYLRDLDIAYFLEALVAKKAVVSIVLDSCHSGGATRGDDLTPRCATGGRPDSDPALDTTKRPMVGVAPDDELRAAWKRLLAAGERGASGTTWLPRAEGYVLLAACRDVETAWETRIDAGGVLTAAFLDAIRDPNTRDWTWAAVYERVRAGVENRVPSQTPQLLGQGERLVLGVPLQPVVVSVPVSKVDTAKRQVLLGAGQAQAIREGATFGIYLPGTTDFTQPDRRVGAAHIDEAMAVASWATLDKDVDMGKVKPGAPALLEDLGTIQLKRVVKLLSRNDLPPEIDQAAALTALGAAIKTRGRGFLEFRAEATPYYQIALDKDGAYEICDASGKRIPNVGTVAIDAPAAAALVVDRLMHLLRYDAIMRLETTRSRLKGQVKIEVLEAPPGWSPSDAPQGGTRIEGDGDSYVRTAGQYVFFHITNLSEHPVNVAVIDLGDDYGIRSLEPVPDEGDLIPRFGYSTVNTHEDKYVPVRLYVNEGQESALDTVKIFATYADTDYRWLLHLPIGSSVNRSPTARGDGTDAFDQLREAFDADHNTLRGLSPLPVGEDWMVRQIRITTKRS